MKKGLIASLLLLPVVSYAQVGRGIIDIIDAIQNIVNLLIPVLVTLAMVVFFWGLVKYIMNASDEAAKEGGKNLMIWGMIALFVMVALWAILGWAQTLLGISGDIDTGTVPVIVTPGASAGT